MTGAELNAVHGIGRATAGKVMELLQNGTIALLEELRPVPVWRPGDDPALGAGTEKALALHDALGVGTWRSSRWR